MSSGLRVSPRLDSGRVAGTGVASQRPRGGKPPVVAARTERLKRTR